MIIDSIDFSHSLSPPFPYATTSASFVQPMFESGFRAVPLAEAKTRALFGVLGSEVGPDQLGVVQPNECPEDTGHIVEYFWSS